MRLDFAVTPGHCWNNIVPPMRRATIERASATQNRARWENHMNEWWMQGQQYVLPAMRIVGIVVAAILSRALINRIVHRIGERYAVPHSLSNGANRLATIVILAVGTLLVLDQLGVSAAVLWTASPASRRSAQSLFSPHGVCFRTSFARS